MGAEVQVYHTGITDRDAGKTVLNGKHRELKEEAEYDHGHSGYSGTIAESPGLKIVRGSTVADSDDLYDEIYNFTGKWGNTVAIWATDSEQWLMAGIYSS